VALGDMAMALARAHSAEDMEGCLDAVAAQIREAIAPPAKGRSRTHSPEALNVRWLPAVRVLSDCLTHDAVQRRHSKPSSHPTAVWRIAICSVLAAMFLFRTSQPKALPATLRW